MRIGILRADLLLPMSHSLKDKRRPIKSLLGRLRQRFNVSAAEVEYQELHQRAVIGVGLVASDGDVLAKEIHAVKEFIMLNPECQVLEIQDRIIGWQGE